MGLFGLFVSIVGLGAMTKDGIENSIFTQKNYEEAKRDGKPYYYGSGSKTYSTKTGRECYIGKDWNTGQEWIVDMQTGEKIENYSDYKNGKRTLKNINNSVVNGKMFYQTHEFDSFKSTCKKSDVYKCRIMDGFFNKSDRYDHQTCHREYIYQKGEVVFDDFYGVKVEPYKNKEWYFEDGTPFTYKKFEERIEAIKKERQERWRREAEERKIKGD